MDFRQWSRNESKQRASDKSDANSILVPIAVPRGFCHSTHAQIQVWLLCACSENWTLPEVAILDAYSSPEDALLLVSTKNRDLWPGLIFLSMCREFVSYSQPIRVLRLDSEHAQSDRKSVSTKEDAILVVDQKKSGLWPGGRECANYRLRLFVLFFFPNLPSQFRDMDWNWRFIKDRFSILLLPFWLETLELCFNFINIFMIFYICSNEIKLIPKINAIIERLASQT